MPYFRRDSGRPKPESEQRLFKNLSRPVKAAVFAAVFAVTFCREFCRDLRCLS